MSADLRIIKTRGGSEYVQEFVTGVNPQTCIGCGRCYKVCPRDVFTLVSREEVLEAEGLDEDDDMDDDDEMMVMTVSNPMDCIGCSACARVCPKDCHTHTSLPVD